MEIIVLLELLIHVCCMGYGVVLKVIHVLCILRFMQNVFRVFTHPHWTFL